ncbi:DNA/RNA non-specific endonuclease [Phenylobacterium sp.]|uniref:DNA/RNA non-specific endonuclease n=1 Tax=Phenylobacterium sp. TaxID=1871053 RepID=UPI00301E2E86
MAAMPRGTPRSVPNPVGELYDEMMRQERLKKQAAETPPTSPLSMDTSAFVPFGWRSDAIRQTPYSNDLITIGGRTYRQVDTGQANVLVPTNDPRISPVELAARRRAIENASLMAKSPLAGAAYGLASLMNASPARLEAALRAGSAADALMMVPRVRGAPPPQRLPEPRWDRPNPSYRELNKNGQAQGAVASLRPAMLGTGTRADPRIRPPGWQGHGRDFNEARAHLVAKDFAGLGHDPRNLVTLTHNGANTPEMRGFEQAVKRRVRDGEFIEYSATPLYDAGALPPWGILLTAYGTQGAPVARIVRNPAGRPK